MSGFGFWARRAAAAALVVFACGVAALLAVNVMLAGGLWGDALGVPAIAGLAAYTVVSWFPRFRRWLGVERVRPALLTGFAVLAAYVVFLAMPVVAVFLGWTWVLAAVVGLLLLGPLVALGRWIAETIRSAGGIRASWSAVPTLARVGGAVLLLALFASLAPRVVDIPLDILVPDEEAAPEPLPAARTTPVAVDLALAFRPRLYFDSKEEFSPLEIATLVKEGQIQQCPEDGDCVRVLSAGSFATTYKYLKISEEVLAPGSARARKYSAYYYRFTRAPDSPEAYLDYWWYFSSNPSPIARSLLCGPGTRWFPLACGHHPSDWEGATVVLTECTAEAECVRSDVGSYRPTAVRYAQHDGEEQYAWPALKRRWNELRQIRSAPWSTAPADARPLVFVARLSHAAYREPCGNGTNPLVKRLLDLCPQDVRKYLRERRDGLQAWVNNECEQCLQELPLTSNGEPAEWNAFEGRWGRRQCILDGAFCDTGDAPESPAGQEDRYDSPEG